MSSIGCSLPPLETTEGWNILNRVSRDVFYTKYNSEHASNNPKIPDIYFFSPLPEWYFSKESNRMNMRYFGNSRNRKHIPLTCMVRTAQAQVQGSYHQITVKSLPPEQNQYKSSREEKKRVTESLRWAPSRRPECRRLCGKTLSGLLHLRYRQHRFSRMEFEYQRLDLLLNTMPSLVVDYSNKKWDH